MNIINEMLVDKCFPDNVNARTVVPAYKDKTASGNPITLTDSAENKPLGMTLYGRSKQDGTPSPENPVEIESAGGDGKIGVSVRGKNLFHITKESDCDKKFNKDTKRIILPGEYVIGLSSNNFMTSLADYNVDESCVSFTYEQNKSGYGIAVGIACEHGKTYKHSRQSNSSNVAISFYDTDGTFITYTHNNPFTVPENAKYTVFVLNNSSTTKVGNTVSACNIQIEEGTDVAAYESYRIPQSTSIITPNGLPGIPVPSNTAGITYTDARGQAWIADEIDLERGKYVQRVWKVVFDGSEKGWFTYANNNVVQYIIDNVLPANLSVRRWICNKLTTGIYIGLFTKRIYFQNLQFADRTQSDYGLSDFKANIAEYPLVVMTYLNTPIERDLTSSELAEYTQLYSYKPTTVVENDSDCWMDVTYKAGTSGKSKNEALRWYFKNVMPLVG